MKHTMTMLVAGLGTALVASTALAQTAMNADERAESVRALASIVRDEFFDEARAHALADALETDLAQGAYDDVTDAEGLAARISEQLHAADRHFGVQFIGPETAAAMIARRSQAEEGGPAQRPEDPWGPLRRANFGFASVEILPGNIGYIDLRQFAPITPAVDTARAALDFVANTDAVIFDLRQNVGGAPSMVQFLISHFLDPEEPVVINTFVSRDLDYPDQLWALASHPSGFRPETPLYVLTSGRTGSAGEAFPYHLKAMERATVIGETTYGAGNPGDTFFTPQGFSIFVSTGSARNPITLSNWEGTGVEPHISVPAEQALDRALAEAYGVLIGQTEDPARRRGLEWAAESLEARLSPRDMRPSQLSAYAGQYGERTISVEAGQLHYARDGGTPQPLIALGDHRFAFTDTSDIRVVFDMNGRIADAMEFHMADGRARRYPRGE